MAIEKVRHLDEPHARQLLDWLQVQESAITVSPQPAGAMAMLGFARRFRTEPRATADWMNELRAGELERWPRCKDWQPRYGFDVQNHRHAK